MTTIYQGADQTMGDRKCLALFVLEKNETARTLEELLGLIGCTNIQDIEELTDESGQSFHATECQWATVWCRASKKTILRYQTLIIYLSQSGFYDLGGASPSRHPLAQAFVTACERLSPLAAMITLLPQKANYEVIKQVVDLVDQWEVNDLADQWFSALYLDEMLMAFWQPGQARNDREFRHLARGIVAFDCNAEARW
jgi:hypothetical protein